MKNMQLRPNQLPATIYENNEITCGNSYSTLWHVTSWAAKFSELADPSALSGPALAAEGR